MPHFLKYRVLVRLLSADCWRDWAFTRTLLHLISWQQVWQLSQYCKELCIMSVSFWWNSSGHPWGATAWSSPQVSHPARNWTVSWDLSFSAVLSVHGVPSSTEPFLQWGASSHLKDHHPWRRSKACHSSPFHATCPPLCDILSNLSEELLFSHLSTYFIFHH